MGKTIEDRIKEIITNILNDFEEEFTLSKLEVKDKGKQGLIRAYIDKPEGITIDDCANISKELSVQLDVADLMNGPYRLEVSSPGINEKDLK